MNSQAWPVLPRGLALLTAVLLLGACAGNRIPADALRLHESSLELRSKQSRIFEAESEEAILAASVGLLQDMEFNLELIEKPLGVLTASKDVDADSTSEKISLITLDVLCAFSFSNCDNYSTASDKQIVSLTLVVTPSLARPGDFVARVTIQYVEFDKMNRVKKRSTIEDAAVYQEIFTKLSQSLFLGGTE
ncbi:MAG: hypothetical protein WBN31_07560 [Gammaproteobacteria bacterium]